MMLHRRLPNSIISILLACAVSLLLTATPFANPSFTIGSDPYLTKFAYPHDILRWPSSGAFLSLNSQTLPWQGDVTDIARRPSESYTNNYQEVEFAPPDGYEGPPEDMRSWMRVGSYVYESGTTLGGLYDVGIGRVYLEIKRTSLDMDLSAEGIARASEDSVYHLVPFEAKTNASRKHDGLEAIYAGHLFDNPFGLKLGYRSKSSGRPEGNLEFTREGEVYSVPHLTWGWATRGCNKILGYSHINTDAFFLNSYSVFNGHQLDLQGSYEHQGNYKSGIRYRSIREEGDSYKWKYDEGSKLTGQYQADEYWRDRKSTDLLRGYSKVRFYGTERLDTGLLFFSQYASHATHRVNKLAASEPASEQAEAEFIVEANPFVNYRFKGGYLDFGVLVELARANLRNTSTQWNNISKSDQRDVLWSTSPYMGWSPSWENFSRGSRWFFATGFESYTSVNVYRRLSLLGKLTVLRKYTFTTKDYGKSAVPAGGTSLVFEESYQRNDTKSEAWMTGAFGLAYGWGPIQAIVSLQLPLAYLLKQGTELSNTEGTLFEHSKKNMWQVQEPTAARFLLVYALGGRPVGH